MATDKSGVFIPDSSDPNATGINFGSGPADSSLPATDLPTIKLQREETVGYFLGEDLIDPVDMKQSAQNYASAFDPSGTMYSVNTGNASVRQLEDLRGLLSTEPPVVQKDNTFAIPTALLGLLFLI